MVQIRPVWVDTQQAAELYGALAALDRFASYPHLQLVLDNMGAISRLLWGRAKTRLSPQHRILRRLSHCLHWSGALLSLYYIKSAFNLADSVSRVFDFDSASEVVVQARA